MQLGKYAVGGAIRVDWVMVWRPESIRMSGTKATPQLIFGCLAVIVTVAIMTMMMMMIEIRCLKACRSVQQIRTKVETA